MRGKGREASCIGHVKQCEQCVPVRLPLLFFFFLVFFIAGRLLAATGLGFLFSFWLITTGLMCTGALAVMKRHN